MTPEERAKAVAERFAADLPSRSVPELVVGFNYGYVRVLSDGKETTVFIVNIDSGWDEEYAPGCWRVRIEQQRRKGEK